MSPPGGTTQRLRYWIGPSLAILLSLTLLLLPEGARTRSARLLEQSIYSPFRYAVGWGKGSLASEREVRRLASLRTEERLDQDRTLEVQQENVRLRRLLGFQRRGRLELEPGSVVAQSRGRVGDLLEVEIDAEAAVPIGAPVLVPEGLLGWVHEVAGTRVRVECLTNREVTASVLNQRTREEGILRWSQTHRTQLVIHEVPLQADWKRGDRIITSGLGTIFPRGLLVGWVTRLERDAAGPFKRIFVRPSASPARAEEVFLVLSVGQSGSLQPEDPERESIFPTDPGSVFSQMRVDDGRGLSPGPIPTR